MALQLSLIKFNGGSYEKSRIRTEIFRGKVQIELFDGDILTGFLQKTGAERFRNNPDLYLRRGFYCLTETLESQDCVNFLIFRFSHVQKIKFV